MNAAPMVMLQPPGFLEATRRKLYKRKHFTRINLYAVSMSAGAHRASAPVFHKAVYQNRTGRRPMGERAKPLPPSVSPLKSSLPARSRMP
jgi:hypothetical protein